MKPLKIIAKKITSTDKKHMLIYFAACFFISAIALLPFLVVNINWNKIKIPPPQIKANLDYSNNTKSAKTNGQAARQNTYDFEYYIKKFEAIRAANPTILNSEIDAYLSHSNNKAKASAAFCYAAIKHDNNVISFEMANYAHKFAKAEKQQKKHASIIVRLSLKEDDIDAQLASAMLLFVTDNDRGIYTVKQLILDCKKQPNLNQVALAKTYLFLGYFELKKIMKILFFSKVDYNQILLAQGEQLYLDSKVHLNNALKLLADPNGVPHVLIGRIQFILADLHHFHKDHFKALQHYKEAFYVYQQNSPICVEPNLYYQIGYKSEEVGLYNQALKFYINYNIVNDETDMLNNRIGNVYYKTGNYQQALIYFNKALKKWDAHRDQIPIYNKHMASGYDNLGLVAIEKNELEKAISYFKKSLVIWIDWYGENHWDVALGNQQIGRAHIAQNKFIEAEHFLNKSLTIRKALYKNKGEDVATSYYYLGECFLNQGRLVDAINTYDLAQTAFFNKCVNSNPLKAKCLLGKALAYRKLGNLNKADSLLQYAISIQQINSDSNISVQFYTPLLALELLSEKVDLANALALNLAPNEQFNVVKKLLPAIDQALEIEHYLRSSYLSNTDKILLSSKVENLYNLAIDLSYFLFTKSNNKAFKQMAFQYSEWHKSRILLEDLQKSTHVLKGGLPDSILVDLKGISRRIELLNKVVWEEKGNANYSKNEIVKLAGKLVNAKEEKRLLWEGIRLNYPSYFNTANRLQDIDSTAILNKTAQNEAFISYYLTATNIHVFAFANNRFKWNVVQLDSTFLRTKALFLSAVNDKNAAREKLFDTHYISMFYKSATALYSSLLKPIIGTKKNINALVIAPYGTFNLIPFQALVQTEKTPNSLQFRNLPYLLNSYNFRYAYSGSLYANASKSKNNYSKYFAGFAPKYSAQTSNSSLTPLEHNLAEVTEIATLVKGDVFVNQNANKSTFTQALNNYSTLHLAMHAIVNQENSNQSALYFNANTQDSTQFLTVQEIYNLPIKTNLLVMSACNTNAGAMVNGEGVFSLARAFRYAGCPNIVASLWPVGDRASSEIMRGFYQSLYADFPKAEALQLAQISFIETAKNPHPYYWSSFVLLGDNEPVALGKRQNKLPYVLLSALVIIAVLVKLKWKKKNLA